jgi:hypothetical protein
VECFKPEVSELPDDFDSLDESTRRQLLKDHIEYYCPEHCQAHGYCWSCGFYQSGVPGAGKKIIDLAAPLFYHFLLEQGQLAGAGGRGQ